MKTLSVSRCLFIVYVELDDPRALRDELYAEWSQLGVLGRVYLADEGVNAQISVPEHNFDAFKKSVYARTPFKDVPFNLVVEEGLSFLKLAIKVRHEIVSYQIPTDQYDMSIAHCHLCQAPCDHHVDCAEWWCQRFASFRVLLATCYFILLKVLEFCNELGAQLPYSLSR